MKKLIFLLSLVLLTVACEKSRTQDFEIPAWIQERITHDEEIIRSNPQSGLDIAAWIRYEYNSKVYYEYYNHLSSAGPEIYQDDGTELHYGDINIYEYQAEKCCRYYIWRGPSYIDIYDR